MHWNSGGMDELGGSGGVSTRYGELMGDQSDQPGRETAEVEVVEGLGLGVDATEDKKR